MTRAEIQQVKQRFGIIGNTEALLRAIDVAIQVAPTDLSVLITGESGVGKKVFRRLFINIAGGSTGSILLSTVVLFRKVRLIPNCSGMRRVRLPVRLANGKGTLAKPMVVLFSLTK